MSPLLEVRGVTKRYPGVTALHAADLTLEAGSILGLVGKNGAGKSTLIKVLAGVVEPDEGALHLDGEPVTVASPREATALGFAFVHQELADIPNLTVAENIQLGLGYPRTLGMVRRGELRRRARAILDRLGADVDPDARLSTLSVAERRLVMIAHGMATDARVFVLDEPTASLTEDEIVHLHAVLRKLRDDGVAIVYVSHRLDEIFAITDRVAVMRDGRSVFAAPTGELTMAQLIEHITGGVEVAEERDARRTAGPQEELLRVEGLTADRVHGASFVVRRGDVLGIAGLVGAGRTELVRMVFGADKATSGTITVRGKETRIRSPRDAMAAGIVLLPEDRRTEGAVLSFSVRKNVTLPGLARYRRSPALPVPHQGRERTAARGLAERLGIKVAHVEVPVRTLSGGNQQKVVLAKWLESGADVFIFDEPTHGVDVEGKHEVYDLMDELAAEGRGVIFISSEFTELVGACNRVIVMREGRFVDELEGDQITDGALIERCYAA
jgi:ABC-type sugar transport system ATPase subunit